jgi:iron complex outermembrane recepter protein
LAFLDAKYDEFDPANANPRVNNTGKQLIKSPKISGNIGYQYSWDLFGGDVTARGSMFFTQKYYLQPTNIDLTSQPGYRRTDLSLTYTSGKDSWSVQAYGKNLENNNIIAGLGGLAAPNAFLAPPRTYGMRVAFKF